MTRPTRFGSSCRLFVIAAMTVMTVMATTAPHALAMQAKDAVPDTPAQPNPSADLGSTTADEQDAKDEDHEKQPSLPVDLSSPRATMRTFLVAMQEAAADKPERVDDAVACLDTSELQADDVAQQARAKALQLDALIDRIGVKLDDIPGPEEAEAQSLTSYDFFVGNPLESGSEPPRIQLALNTETGRWTFAPRTLAALPEIEKSLAETETPKEAEHSDVPAAYASPRATMSTFIKAMNGDPQDFVTAVSCLDPTGQPKQAWDVAGKDLAVKLKFVMDRIKLVALKEIPGAPTGEPYAWHTSDKGNIVLDRVTEDASELHERWLFTPETLAQLADLYDHLERAPRIEELREAGVKEDLPFELRLQRSMPPWLRSKHFYLQGWQWIALASLLVVGWLIRLLVTFIVSFGVRTWVKRKDVDLDRAAQRRAMKWSGWIACSLFWFYTIQVLQLPAGLLAVLMPGLRIIVVATCIWFGYRLVDLVGSYVGGRKDLSFTQVDDLLIPFVRAILRIVVVLVVVLLVLEWMDYKVTTLLGALGIGGMALAFAAQDTLGNFFGSITVLFDRPFGIGDWVVIGEVEGTVEKVGFRSTRIRTFYNSMITIPNAKMTNTHVDNYGARRYRRVRTMLSLTYSTPPDKIDAFCEGVRELIRLHPYTRKDYYHVYFNQLSASSLDVLLYAFFDVPDWSTELREKHRLFVDILRLADRLGVEFAFPTQTVWLQRTQTAGEAPDPGLQGEDPDIVGLHKAATVFEEAYGAEPKGRGPVVIDMQPLSPQLKKTRNDADTSRGA